MTDNVSLITGESEATVKLRCAPTGAVVRSDIEGGVVDCAEAALDGRLVALVELGSAVMCCCLLLLEALTAWAALVGASPERCLLALFNVPRGAGVV